MSAQVAERIVVGRVGAAHGVKGWVKIHSFTEPAGNLFDYQPLVMGRGGDRWEAIEIDQWREQGKALVAHIRGCDDRDAAVLLAGRELACDAGVLAPLDDGDYYWSELEGMAVYARQGAAEVLLGRIDHLLATGANDVIVVHPTGDSVDDRERLIPWLLDRFVLAVDRSARRVLVDWDPEF